MWENGENDDIIYLVIYGGFEASRVKIPNPIRDESNSSEKLPSKAPAVEMISR